MDTVLIIILEVLIRMAQILSWLVVINAIMSFFLPPFNTIRQTFDRFLEPLISPIRQRVPPAGMFDFSPLILWFILQILIQVMRGIQVSI